MGKIKDVLNQQIRFRLEKRRPSTSTKCGTRTVSRSYPKKIIYWENFKAEAACDNRNDDDKLNGEPTPYKKKEPSGVKSEEHVRQQFLFDIAMPLSCCLLGNIEVGDFGTTLQSE